jgi:hypothetical protein
MDCILVIFFPNQTLVISVELRVLQVLNLKRFAEYVRLMLQATASTRSNIGLP